MKNDPIKIGGVTRLKLNAAIVVLEQILHENHRKVTRAVFRLIRLGNRNENAYTTKQKKSIFQ